MELRILIVDDEGITGRLLKSIIEEVPDVKVVAVATSAREALQQAELQKPQVVFLDIDMPEMNGIELAGLMRERQQDLYIVFATAHPDYALQAFELYSFDYILKPFNESRIRKTVRKLKEKINTQNKPGVGGDTIISLEYNGRKVFLKPTEIFYLESRKPKKIFIKTAKHDYLIRGDLNTLAQKLEQQDFFRCHRAFLVNLKQIKEIIPSGHTYEIILYSNDRVLLSRQHEKTLREKALHS